MDTLSALTPAAKLKREQILQGALQMFLQEGFEGTSMDRVAAAAGVSKITIYKHFQDKEGVFKALVERVTAQRFQTVFGNLSFADDPEVVLRHLAHNLLDMMAIDEEYIAFLRLIIGESGRFPELAQLFIRALPQKVWALLGNYFAAHPELHLSDPEATARIFMGALMSYVLTQKILHGQAIAPMSPDLMIDCLIDTLIQPPCQGSA
ncbi:TetR/AcrR family transcriptional regulator [Nodosilinea nodulosa]|uniref:TetR/AcrR family transcriptional regulator n=1 Tax=Nodosilinea nodulosa TaxID=416001 RepID=UPI0002FDFEE9|nr:TetR/AcrR family transcriptional regulator [Nodosilinea nodulosa]